MTALMVGPPGRASRVWHCDDPEPNPRVPVRDVDGDRWDPQPDGTYQHRPRKGGRVNSTWRGLTRMRPPLAEILEDK